MSLALLVCSDAEEVVESEHTVELAPFQEILVRRDQYRTIETEILEEKSIPSLSEVLETKSKLWIVPQVAFRLDRGEPAQHTAILDEKYIYLYDLEAKESKRIKADSRHARPIMLLVGMGPEATYEGWLENFDPIETITTPKTYQIKFTPQSGTVKRMVTEMSITFDLKTAFPTLIEWAQKDGTTVKTHFHSTVFDEGIKEDCFALLDEEDEEEK